MSFNAPSSSEAAQQEQIVGVLTDRTRVPLAEARALNASPSRASKSSAAEKKALTEPVRILLVDSDRGEADSLEVMLHASGYSDTRVAYSGHAALAIAAVFRPDIVLLDLSLPDLTGYEVAQSLREQAQSRRLRLIALTSSRAHAGREQARVAGFERYLLKPVASLELSELMAPSYQ